VINKTYTVMEGDPDPLENTALISCSPMGFPNVYEDDASDSVDLLHPDFMLTKECKAEPVVPGRDAEFTVVFANTGDVDLEVYFDEPLTGDGCPATAGTTATVPFGESLTCSVTKTADTDPTESYVENTINAHVTLPAMYGLDNFWDPMASDSCDIYAVKKGTKWDDKNMDGIWDMEEPVLSGWKIHFFEWMGDAYAPPKEVLTGANGSYSFNVVKPGVTYAVCEVLEAGYLQTYPNVEMPAEGFVDCTQFGSEYGPIGYEIMLASGVYELENDFGNFKPLGCTYTQGYWKTHSTYGPAGPYDPTWDLKDGGDAIFLNPMWDTGFSWYSIMWEPPKGGNAYIILAHQYVAAWLNTHNVDPEKMADGSVLGTALSDAEMLLGSYKPEDVLEPAVREEFIMLAEMLDDFNEGYLGVPHCED